MVVGVGLELALGGVVTAVDALRDTLRETRQFAENAQKASLALGLSLERTNQELTPTMQGLRGDINERFAASIAGLEVGMQGNTAGLAHLVNQQRLTGTDSKKTAMAFAKMEMQLGVSRDATNDLAKKFVQIGDEWMVSTDHLVDAMSALEKSFPSQKLAGMGAEVTEAFASLTAELGPSMKGPMESVMKMIMDTSMAGYEKLTMLGIGTVREQLSAAKSSEEAQRILKDAIQKAAGTFKSVVGDASKGFFQIGVASEIFGESAIQLTAVQDAFGERIKKEGEDAADFGNQLAVIKGEILLPLQEAFVAFFPILQDIANIIGGFLKGAIETLTIKILEVWVELGGLEGMIDKVKEKWGEFKELLIKVSGVIEAVVIGALMYFAAKLTIMATITIVKAIFSFGALVAAMLPVTWPFIAIAAAVTAVVALFVFLAVKTGLLSKVVDLAKLAFVKFKNFLGSFLEMLGDKIPFIGDKLKEWGKSLQESTTIITDRSSAVTGGVDEAAKEKRSKDKAEEDKKRKVQDLLKKVQEMNATSRENLGFNKYTSESTASLDGKTKDLEVKTTPEFLDATANMLGRTIEGILGIGRNTIAEETLEEMIRIREAAEVSAEEAAKPASPAATLTEE